MNKKKKEKLKEKGFEVTSVAEFLELSPVEEEIIELRLALSNALRKKRLKAKMSQEKYAERLKTSQSRLAKMEAGDKSVSLDLLIKSLFKSGVDRSGLSEIVQGSGKGFAGRR